MEEWQSKPILMKGEQGFHSWEERLWQFFSVIEGRVSLLFYCVAVLTVTFLFLVQQGLFLKRHLFFVTLWVGMGK